MLVEVLLPGMPRLRSGSKVCGAGVDGVAGAPAGGAGGAAAFMKPKADPDGAVADLTC